MEKIYINKSKVHGRGMFAKTSIARKERILILRGDIIHWVVKDQKTSLAHPNWIGIKKDRWISVKAPAIYINHSCNPNAGIKGSRIMVALRTIRPGEEITIDYSITEQDTLWHLKCVCGEKNCRKIIRSIQFLPKRVFNRYLPYIPTYFKKSYLKYNN